MQKKSGRIFFQYVSTCILIVSISFSFHATAYAQFSTSTLMSSVNVQGIGAVALNCTSANQPTTPFGSIGQTIGSSVGGGLGTLGGGALGEAVGGETGEQVGQVVGGIGGALAGAWGGQQLGNLISGGGAGSGNGTIQSVVPGQTVPVSDAQVQSITTSIQTNTQAIEGEEKTETKKESCLDKIAQTAAIQIMDYITLVTLNWINSGFEGKPFYLENPEQFFSDLATKELLGFSATFSGNAELYPFGDTLARTVLLAFQRSFQQNMINSLNNVLNHGTRAEWETNFSVGGWAGYTAFVEPNNNIFGSYIESSRNLQTRLQGTRNSVAVNLQAELQQGMGFLSQRVCAETQNGGQYIPQNSVEHTVVGVPVITEINQIPTNVYTYITACEADDVFDTDGDGEPDSDGLCEGFDEDVIEVAENFRGRSICTRWKTTTPGNIIAQSAFEAVVTPQRQAALVDEAQEDIGLILDALMLQLVNEGVAAFTEDNPNNSVLQQVNGENPGQSENTVPFIDAINGFEGSGNSGEFLGVIPLQEEYIEKVTTLLELYGEVFQRTLDLDYCLPGPNPNWQVTSADAITLLLSQLPAYESLPQEVWAESTPGVFGGLAESIASFEIALDSDTLYEYIAAIYSSLIQSFTGVSFDWESLNPEINDKETQLIPILSGSFNDYASLINERFLNADDFDGNLREEAQGYFASLGEVEDAVALYAESLLIVEDTLEQLIELREEYADIERQYIVEQLLVAVNEQGITSLQDNLATFQGFSPAQVTYIGNDGQNSAYHNAVLALVDELGGTASVTPPVNYEGYNNILEDFVDLMPYTANQNMIEDVEDETEIALEAIGNPSDGNSLIGMIYSCIQQIEEIGDYQNIPFTGYTERKVYPFPISTDIPGLLTLPITATFMQDKTVSTDEDEVTVMLTPVSEVEDADNLQTFESVFLNLGQTLY